MTILTGDFSIDCGMAEQRLEIPAAMLRATPQPEAHASDSASDAMPDDAKLYLRHIEDGISIRALARELGCHASTILRRIRRFEARRDDPLVDGALTTKAENATPRNNDREMLRILRRLAEPGAVMAAAEGMEKAIVTRNDIRTAVLDRQLAEEMALRGWVAQLGQGGRIQRYTLVPSGREALRRMLKSPRQRNAVPGPGDFSNARPVSFDGSPPTGAPANQTTARSDVMGMAEAPAGFDHAERHRVWDERVIQDPEDGRRRRARVNIAESPLLILARRRDGNGQPFLSPGMVAAGERLREDFELAQMGPRITQNWDGFMTAGIDTSQTTGCWRGGSDSARDRVALALRDLGPGMGDIVLRVCCFLEGIEMTERRLGWSARSGKIVLRLSLMRLERHYQEVYGGGSPLIG